MPWPVPRLTRQLHWRCAAQAQERTCSDGSCSAFVVQAVCRSANAGASGGRAATPLDKSRASVVTLVHAW